MMITAGKWVSALLLAVLMLGPVPASAQEVQRPLLAEGKTSVYQRVLTRPGALLHDAAGGAATRTYPTFLPL